MNSFLISSFENIFRGYKFKIYKTFLLFKREDNCILDIEAGSVRSNMKRIVEDANYRHLNEFLFFLFFKLSSIEHFLNHTVLEYQIFTELFISYFKEKRANSSIHIH